MSFETTGARGLNLFQLASARMDWLSQRQEVIAGNIANADTPGYAAREMTPFEALLSSGRSESREAAQSWDQSRDGNGVVLEQQQLLAAETESSHRLATLLYRKGHDLISLAAGKR